MRIVQTPTPWLSLRNVETVRRASKLGRINSQARTGCHVDHRKHPKIPVNFSTYGLSTYGPAEPLRLSTGLRLLTTASAQTHADATSPHSRRPDGTPRGDERQLRIVDVATHYTVWDSNVPTTVHSTRPNLTTLRWVIRTVECCSLVPAGP